MNPEFEKLYKEHYAATAFLSYRLPHCPTWDALVEWSKANKQEAVDCIIEMLQEEPSDVVGICDELFPDLVKFEGFVPLDVWCNIWLTILEAVKRGEDLKEINPMKFPDHYKDYKKFQKYMEKNYIPWNPFHEEDPNITLEEYKQGKRNDKKLLKKKLKEMKEKRNKQENESE